MNRLLMLFTLLISLVGCMEITTQVQMPNKDAQPLLSGEDCTPIILGLSLGVNYIEQAMKNTNKKPNALGNRTTINPPITKVHMVEYYEGQFLVVGLRCVQVTGEP